MRYIDPEPHVRARFAKQGEERDSAAATGCTAQEQSLNLR